MSKDGKENKKIINKSYKLLFIFVIVILGVGIFFIIDKDKTTHQEIAIEVPELPLKINKVPLTFNIVNTPEGNILECVFKNDSSENINKFVLDIRLKDTGEIVELNCNGPIMAGQESPKFIGKGPASGNIEDVEVMKYRIATNNGVYMEYDTELKQYNWS